MEKGEDNKWLVCKQSQNLCSLTAKKLIAPQAGFVKILRLRSGFRLAAQTPPDQLKMYYFALEPAIEIG